MPTTNQDSGTRIDEVADGIYRISTPVPPSAMPGGFTFNQYLLLDDEPLLFHTGPRRLFPLVRQAIEHVMPVARLRWISYSHHEADESGAMNELLAVAPRAEVLTGEIGAMVSMTDLVDRPVRGLADGETVSIGAHRVRWIATPHMPHGWDCGFLFEEQTATLLAGDLFTQPGHEHAPLVETDILEPSEAMRAHFGYFAHGRDERTHLERLAALQPKTLACMHGSAWRGDGAGLLTALADRLSADR